MKATLIASSEIPVVDDAVSFPAASPLAADPLPPDAPCFVDESGVHAASNSAPTTTSATTQRPYLFIVDFPLDRTIGGVGYE
jgi:hypothetical protein